MWYYIWTRVFWFRAFFYYDMDFYADILLAFHQTMCCVIQKVCTSILMVLITETSSAPALIILAIIKFPVGLLALLHSGQLVNSLVFGLLDLPER